MVSNTSAGMVKLVQTVRYASLQDYTRGAQRYLRHESILRVPPYFFHIDVHAKFGCVIRLFIKSYFTGPHL